MEGSGQDVMQGGKKGGKGKGGGGGGGGGGGRGVRGVDFGLGIGYNPESTSTSQTAAPSRSTAINSLRTGMMAQFRSNFVAASSNFQTDVSRASRPLFPGFVSGGSIGILGVGLAGLLLFGGLTFATLSLRGKTRRNTSGVKQQMKPLTTEQKVLLTSDDQIAKIVQDGNETSAMPSDKENKINGHDPDSVTVFGRLLLFWFDIW